MDKRKAAAGAIGALALAGGGAAVAARELDSPKRENDAIISDAAQQLGVQPQALSDALKKALENRVDAAVAAGRLTKQQGDALEQRIEAGNAPLFAPLGFGFGRDHDGAFAPFGGLRAAASYLGLTVEALRAELQSGKTLAQVAAAHGKSVDGLVAALVADAKTHLDAAVAAGRLTQAQEDEILSELKQRIADRVNGKLPRFHERPGFRPRALFRRFA